MMKTGAIIFSLLTLFVVELLNPSTNFVQEGLRPFKRSLSTGQKRKFRIRSSPPLKSHTSLRQDVRPERIPEKIPYSAQELGGKPEMRPELALESVTLPELQPKIAPDREALRPPIS